MKPADLPAALAELQRKLGTYKALGKRPPGALLEALADIEFAVGALESKQKAHPLAYARLWAPECRTCAHPDPNAIVPPKGRRGMPMEPTGAGMMHRCPACGVLEARTSQVGVVRAMLAGDYDKAFILGGSRTGKTEAGAQLAVAIASGSDDPDVRAWADLNDLDLSRIQRHPGVFWAVSQTFNMSRTIQRAKLDAYLPTGSVRRSWQSDNEAEVKLPAGGRITCKAFAQNTSEGNARNPFEGARIHGAWIDEEPQSPQGFESITARTIDFDGLTYATMTPLSGWTSFLSENVGHLDKGTPAPRRLFVAFIHALDNPYVSAEVVTDKWGNKPEAIRRSRLRGEIVALEGAVHPDFHNGAPYVVPAFAPPPEWQRFGSIDFGSRAPFAHLWGAYDDKADVLHIFREHYAPDLTIHDHAAAIWRVEGCPDCQPSEVGSDLWRAWLARHWTGTGCQTCNGSGLTVDAVGSGCRWADPESASDRNTLYEQYSIATETAIKARRPSFDSLFSRLAIRPKWGTPGVVIHDCCSNLIRETQRLTWRGKSRPDHADRMETDGDDHAHDALRYLCHALRNLRPEPAEAEAEAPKG